MIVLNHQILQFFDINLYFFDLNYIIFICYNDSINSIVIISIRSYNIITNSICNVYKTMHPSQRRSPEYQLGIEIKGPKLLEKQSRIVISRDALSNSSLWGR